MRIFLAAALIALTAACATTGPKADKPAGIGGGPNNLRRAPCACLELKSKPGLPAFLQASSISGAQA